MVFNRALVGVHPNALTDVTEGLHMNNPKAIVPHVESGKLLALPTREAEQLFQSYEKQQQLEIIRATRDPREREQLYYLVPDCTELIQESPAQEVLQVLDTMLGTGLAAGLLPCLSNEQFAILMDTAIWRDGKLDEASLDLWLFELSECERDDLGRLLSEIDIRLLAQLLDDRVTLSDGYGALLLAEGLLEPGSPSINYADERARAVVDAVWEADTALFEHLISEIAAIGEEGDIEELRDAATADAQADRDERVVERDREAGIDVTEADLSQEVDLGALELREDEEEEEDYYYYDDDDE